MKREPCTVPGCPRRVTLGNGLFCEPCPSLKAPTFRCCGNTIPVERVCSCGTDSQGRRFR